MRPGSDWQDLRDLGTEIALGDVTDGASVEEAVRGVAIVYHLAAVFRRTSLPARVPWEVNVEGTRNVLAAARKYRVERVVHCSTVGVHGAIEHPPADETAPYRPGDIYQRTKCEAEKIARRFFTQEGLPGVVVRPAGLYGPGDTRFLKLYRLIYHRRFVMFGSGEVLYHLTYIDDFIEGLMLCGTRPEALGGTYILAGERAVTLNEFVRTIARALGVPLPEGHLPVAPLWLAGALCEAVCRPLGLEPPLHRRRVNFFRHHRAFDISKARRELGYAPATDLETGVRKTAAWYREQGWIP